MFTGMLFTYFSDNLQIKMCHLKNVNYLPNFDDLAKLTVSNPYLKYFKDG